MNGLTLDTKSELAELRERQGGQVLRAAKPLVGRVGASTDGDRRSCTEAIGLNLSGRDIPAGLWGYVEDDLSTTDRTADFCSIGYVAGSGHANVRDTGFLPLGLLSLPFTAPQGGLRDDDLVLLMGDDPDGGSLREWSYNGVSLTDGIPQEVDDLGETGGPYTGTPIGGCAHAWGSELTFVDGAAFTRVNQSISGDSSVMYLVLRGVRHPDLVNEQNSGLIGWQQVAFTQMANGVINPSFSAPEIVRPDGNNYLLLTFVKVFASVNPNDATDSPGWSIGSGESGLFPHGQLGPTTQLYAVGYDATYIPAQEATGGATSLTMSPTIYTSQLGALNTPINLINPNWRIELSGLLLQVTEPLSTDPPAPTCNSLVVTELSRTTALSEDTGTAQREAKGSLKRERLRYPVLAKETVAQGGVGTFVREGYTEGWVYLTDPKHRWAGPPLENATRSAADKLGRYFRRLQKSPIDPLASYFKGDPQVLFSTNKPTGVEIVKLAPKVATQPLTITANLERRETSGDTAFGIWGVISTTEGYSDDRQLPMRARPTDIVSAGGIILSRFARPYVFLYLPDNVLRNAASRELYGPRGALELTSTNGRFRGWLWDGYFLIIEPIYTPFAALALGETLTDTFVLTADTSVGDPPACHPWHYVDPADGSAEGFDLAAWPEAIPAIGSPVPTVGADGATVTPTLTIDAAFDPWLGRVPGVGDERHGLQMAFLRIHGRNLGLSPTVVACNC